MGKVDVAAIGEVLIDFIAKEEGPLEKIKVFEKHAGGAPANVMVGTSRLGIKSGLISRVGNDPFGKFLLTALTEEQIDVSQIQIDQEHHTGIVFVQLQKANPEFILYKNVAYNHISYEDIDLTNYVSSLKLLHFGSVLLREDPSRTTTLKTVQFARTKGVVTSFDVNIRKDLWKGKEEMMWEYTRKGIELADIVKFSESELFDFAYYSLNIEKGDIEKAVKETFKLNPKLIVITQGDEGSIIYQNNGIKIHIEPYRVSPVDTTGAGDAFMAALIASLINKDRLFRLGRLSVDDLREIGTFATRIAALSTLKKGAWAVPKLEELEGNQE